MHAVTGAYAKPIFVDKLGASLVRHIYAKYLISITTKKLVQ